MADFSKAIELNPSFAIAYCNRGSAMVTAGELARAIADYDRAIELNPRLVAAYQNRGLARLLSGMDAAAEEDFAKCLELDISLQPVIEKLRKSRRSQ